MLSFPVLASYSAIEIVLFSLYRKKVIAAFKLNKQGVGSKYSFPRKNDDLFLASLGRVVRKPVNANSGLKVNLGNNFSCI